MQTTLPGLVFFFSSRDPALSLFEILNGFLFELPTTVLSPFIPPSITFGDDFPLPEFFFPVLPFLLVAFSAVF